MAADSDRKFLHQEKLRLDAWEMMEKDIIVIPKDQISAELYNKIVHILDLGNMYVPWKWDKQWYPPPSSSSSSSSASSRSASPDPDNSMSVSSSSDASPLSNRGISVWGGKKGKGKKGANDGELRLGREESLLALQQGLVEWKDV